MIRRVAYFVVLVVWLIVMCLPMLAFVLAMRGEFNLGGQENRHVRVFLVQGDEEDGIGFEWTRSAAKDSKCLNSSVRYLLWEGDAEKVNADYCQCFSSIDRQNLYDGPCQ